MPAEREARSFGNAGRCRSVSVTLLRRRSFYPSYLGVDLSAAAPGRLDQILFNESQSRVVISTVSGSAQQVMQLLSERGVSGHRLGEVGGSALAISAAGEALRWSLDEIYDDWFNAIGGLVGET